jgi:Transposase DDE domain
VEERLFAHRRDLFTRLDLVFMDTTSLSFEGAGGQTLGRYGYSKDHRSDLRQLILAVVIDGDGRPVCSEMWPGHTADVTTLIPVIDRLRRRFAIARVCGVADRGLISAETLAELEARRLLYILGVRERADKLVRELVLNDPAPFVPLVVSKRGKQVDYDAKAVRWPGDATSSAATIRRRRRTPPIAPRSSPRSRVSLRRATRRWSAIPATAAI